MIFQKIRTFAQMVGFVTIALLAIYGAIKLLNNANSALAAEINPQESAKAVPVRQDATDGSVPSFINYQGMLRDPEGNPLSGYYTMTFRLYDDVSAPTTAALYSSTHENVTVRNGLFSVLLGDNPNPPLPATLFAGPDRFIGVTVAGFDEMTPRQRFSSVPYAMQAGRANALAAPDGDPTDAVHIDNGGNVGIGTTDTSQRLVVAGRMALLDGSDSQPPGIWFTDRRFPASANFIGTVGEGNIGLYGQFDSGEGIFSRWGLIMEPRNGHIGIGADPNFEYRLNVADNMRVQGRSPYIAFNDPETNRSAAIELRSDGLMGFWGPPVSQPDTPRILVMNTTNGNVGIGTTDPQAKLDIAGDLNVQGNILNFVIHPPVSVEGNNGQEKDELLLPPEIPYEKSMCFLTSVSTDGGGTCEVFLGGTTWQLHTVTYGGGYASCQAACLSWGK